MRTPTLDACLRLSGGLTPTGLSSLSPVRSLRPGSAPPKGDPAAKRTPHLSKPSRIPPHLSP